MCNHKMQFYWLEIKAHSIFDFEYKENALDLTASYGVETW